MKKILLIGLLLLTSYGVQAQKFDYLDGTYQTDLIAVQAWKPFTTDSSTTVYSQNFNFSKYDTIYCWARATSTYLVPKFTVTLQASFDRINYATTTPGVVMDTTNIALQTLVYKGTLATYGATWCRLKFVPVATGALPNSGTSVINVYLLCHKRAGEKQGAQP